VIWVELFTASIFSIRKGVSSLEKLLNCDGMSVELSFDLDTTNYIQKTTKSIKNLIITSEPNTLFL
jgi:hypothetical protein